MTAAPAALLCGLSPFFGTLLTPSRGGVLSASLTRPLAFTCEVSQPRERWEPFVSVAIGYNLEFKLADVRLFGAGGRYRLHANPAWGKSADEQIVLRPSTARSFDPYLTAAASYMHHTVYFLNDAEETSQVGIQSVGGAAGAGVDWYALQDATAQRGGDWKGYLFTAEARLAVLPLALGNPAFQAILGQVVLGAKWIF
jgi:hypothetical protein